MVMMKMRLSSMYTHCELCDYYFHYYSLGVFKIEGMNIDFSIICHRLQK